MNKKFIYALALIITALWPVHGFAQSPPCGCKDLPELVNEIITQSTLANIYKGWLVYMPIMSVKSMGDHAIKDYEKLKQPNRSGIKGTLNGAHVELATDLDTCKVGKPTYNKAGEPTNLSGEVVVLDLKANLDDKGVPKITVPKDNDQDYKTITKKEYLQKKASCSALLEFAWVHEEVHVESCKNWSAKDKENVYVIAKDEVKAYQAGIDMLRKEAAELAKKCGWEGSAKPHIPMPVPILARAQELADKAAAAIKQPPPSAPKPKPPTPGKPPKVIPIIVGAAIDNSPMDALLQRWDQQCAKPTTTATANNCGSLVASIELSLLSLLREIRQDEPVPRAVLFNAAHAQFTQLKRYAMHALGSAQTPEEIEFALAATDHSAPAIRDVARTMLGSSNDPRWLAIQRWWKQDNNFKLNYQTLTPQVSPYPERYGVDSLEGLRYLPYASDDKFTMFTTPEAADKVIARLAKGKTIMANSEDVKKNSEKMQMEFPKLQQEMMAAALSGDMKKIDVITKKITDMQKNLMPADPYAINEDKASTGILLRRDEKTKFPTSVARVRRDAESGLTVVVFDVTAPPVLPQ
jgi:hypothetical protein